MSVFLLPHRADVGEAEVGEAEAGHLRTNAESCPGPGTWRVA